MEDLKILLQLLIALSVAVKSVSLAITLKTVFLNAITLLMVTDLTLDATLKTTMIMSQLVNMKKLSDPPLFYAFCSTERTPSLAQSSTSKSMPSINYHSVNYQTLAVIAGISNSVGVFTF